MAYCSSVEELIWRSKRLAGSSVHGNYEHPAFFVSLNDALLYVGLNNKAGQGQPVTVYMDRTQNVSARHQKSTINWQWVPETLDLMRRVMVLDDVAGV